MTNRDRFSDDGFRVTTLKDSVIAKRQIRKEQLAAVTKRNTAGRAMERGEKDG